MALLRRVARREASWPESDTCRSACTGLQRNEIVVERISDRRHLPRVGFSRIPGQTEDTTSVGLAMFGRVAWVIQPTMMRACRRISAGGSREQRLMHHGRTRRLLCRRPVSSRKLWGVSAFGVALDQFQPQILLLRSKCVRTLFWFFQ